MATFVSRLTLTSEDRANVETKLAARIPRPSDAEHRCGSTSGILDDHTAAPAGSRLLKGGMPQMKRSDGASSTELHPGEGGRRGRPPPGAPDGETPRPYGMTGVEQPSG
jgi:hypothetical protein